MARINIEDKLFSDGRYLALKNILGCEEIALGKLIVSWKLAQTYFQKNGRIPHKVFESAGLLPIFEADLALKEEDGYYVKGTRDQFAWLEQKSVAGKASAEARKEIKEGKKAKNTPKKAKEGNKKQQEVNENERTLNECQDPLERNGNGSQPPTLYSSLSSQSQSIDLSINNNTGEILNFKNAQQKSIPDLMAKLKSLGVTINPDQVIDLFNSKLAGTGKLKHCRDLGAPSRLNMLDTFEKFKTLEDWDHLFDQVKKSKSITGEEPGVFLATLDWLAQRENALKADSGKYNLTSKGHTSTNSYELTDDEINQLREAGEL